LHPGFFSLIGFVSTHYQLQDLNQDALPESFHFLPFGAANNFRRYPSVLMLKSKRRKSRRACGNVGKSCRFLAGLFQAAEGIRVFGGFPQMRHFHQAGNSA
jgi:hypothetical protein